MSDTDLARSLRAALPARHTVAGVATVAGGVSREAVLGANADADFEIGSVSKGVTGLLYADALARGEVTAETTLGELLPMGEVPAARVRVGALSTHTSGLPRLPPSMAPLRRTVQMWRHGTNPYGESLAELLRQARDVPVGEARPCYSNFGYELLGHALASGAGTTYRELLQDRLAGPLRLSSVHAPATVADLRPTSLTGRSRRGRPHEPWTGEALAPAGGVRASAADLGTLVAALLDGSAPGSAALVPRLDFARGVRIGAAWMTLEHKGRTVTWHNGRTGGFATWVGMDRAAGTGVAVLSATSAAVDAAGFRLLTEATASAGDAATSTQ